jgi:hypothetical protein
MKAQIVFDSGTVLIRDHKAHYHELNIGYFEPVILVYCDGRLKTVIQPTDIAARGNRINVRQINSGGHDVTSGISCPQLVQSLLRWSTIYSGSTPPPVLPDRLDVVFNLNSGSLGCGVVKDRNFKTYRGDPPTHTGHNRAHTGVAHDLVAEYTINAGDELMLDTGSGSPLWSSKTCPPRTDNIELLLPVPDSSVFKFYRDVLDLASGQEYWLPNQGHPVPSGGP